MTIIEGWTLILKNINDFRTRQFDLNSRKGVSMQKQKVRSPTGEKESPETSDCQDWKETRGHKDEIQEGKGTRTVWLEVEPGVESTVRTM